MLTWLLRFYEGNFYYLLDSLSNSLKWVSQDLFISFTNMNKNLGEVVIYIWPNRWCTAGWGLGMESAVSN